MIIAFVSTSRLPWLSAATMGLLATLACQSAPEPTPNKADTATSSPRPAFVVTTPFVLATEPIQEPDQEATHLRELNQLTWVGRSGDARFDPSGQRLYYLSLRSPATTEHLYFFDLRGQREHLLVPAGGAVAGPCALDHGVLFARMSSTDQTYRLLRLNDGQATAEEVQAGRSLMDPFDAVRARSSGEIFVSAGAPGQRRLYVLDPDLKHANPLLPPENSSDDSPSPSPDGGRVAFVRHLPAGTTRIMLLNRHRREIQIIAGLPGVNAAPALHPTAPLIVFASSYYGERDYDLFMVSLHNGVVTRLTYHAGFDSLPDFDADGRHLSFTSSRQGGVPQIFVARFEP